MTRAGAARLPARSPETWTLASLYLGGALGSLLGALRPFSDQAPVTLSYACAVTAAFIAALLWVYGDRFGRSVQLPAVVLAIVLISVIIANVATTQGATVTSFAYVWVTIYAAHFFSRRQALAHAGFISVGFATALLVNDLPDAGKIYVVVVGTIWAAVMALSNVVARLRTQADNDQLTGLLNRAGFRVAAEREHALARRTGSPLSLVVIDLDGFKAVNDRSGHSAGDRVLAALSTQLRGSLRACDTVGRHGGDEFVLLLPATTEDGARVVVDRLRRTSPVPWSAGVAVWADEESLDDCFGRADRALYEVKGTRVAEAASR